MSQEPFKVATLCQVRATQHKEAFRINVSDYSLYDVTFHIFTGLLFKAILFDHINFLLSPTSI